jgi:GMP reductase
MDKALNYSDIYLIPEYSELRTRADADISTDFLGRKFKVSWLPANMKSVIDEKIAKWLSENDYFYIYHRFGDTLAFVIDASNSSWKTVSISVGVKQADKDLISYLINSAYVIDFITIDIAHGHHILVKEMIEFIKYIYKKCHRQIPAKIIAGNICTNEAALDLQEWGADAIKVGIAGGAACSTKNMTGFHIPMFTAIQECSKGIHIPIIADGGIKENGDIAKALVAGADMIMGGNIFCACIDSPAENIYEEIPSWQDSVVLTTSDLSILLRKKIVAKRYFGSASYKNKGEDKNIEGFEIDIPCNGKTYEQKYQEIKESLQSAISYAGGKDLKALTKVKWITIK